MYEINQETKIIRIYNITGISIIILIYFIVNTNIYEYYKIDLLLTRLIYQTSIFINVKVPISSQIYFHEIISHHLG